MHCDVYERDRGSGDANVSFSPSAMAAWLLALLGLAVSACAKSSTGNSILVLLEPSLDKGNFSTFFNGLTESGYELTFRAPRDTKPAIIEDDVAQFSHVVVFAPDTKSS